MINLEPPSKKARTTSDERTPPQPQPTPSSSWQEDPRAMNDLPEDQQSVMPEFRRHWHQIRTRFNRRNRLLDWYNYRLSSLQPQEMIQHLDEIFTDQSTVFKLNVSFGFILRNNETGELQYHYASRNNNHLFDSPFQITTAADLQPVREALRDIDVLEWVRQQRPNSKWIVDQVTNVTFFITKLRGHPIGRGSDLPAYLSKNNGLIPLNRSAETGKVYNDNLCFFRALALHNGCHLKNLERDAKHYYERYRKSQPEKKKFCGVKLKELHDLEHLYEINIFVYSLEPTKGDGEEEDDNQDDTDAKPEIAAQLIYRSLCHYTSTLYLNLHQRHFSYIKDMKTYSKSYCCSRCGKFWKHVGMLNRHERTCEAKVHYAFPGGAYKTPPTIFQLLEDEGFSIPTELKYFPYRATFDFECMFSSTTGLNDTEKLTWNAKHIPLSVSVCSNVPGYDQPKCFVSNGDSKQLVKEMIEYLVKISEESYRLLKEEFLFLFEAIDEKLEQLKQTVPRPTTESNIDLGAQEDSGDEGEDLLETDEEEEDIESETKEDRAFLDDEVEEQGPSFYRALDREREEQSDDDQEYIDDKPVNNPEPKNKKDHPLKKLRDRLEEYLKELPVLGFNSGKYDLNAVKEFLFPVLVENEEVLFTIKRNNNFMCLKTEHLRFLDVTNFLAPGFSYDMFLKAYECPQTKGFFPYEWMDSLDKLQHNALPPHEAFFSSLRNENISTEDYQYCQQVWSNNNMQTLKDFLVWYNNLDVHPFCDALDKMCAFWKNKNIDMLRQGISIPGVTLTYLFTTLESGIFFSLFDEKNKDLYYLFKKNMVGGPSIIFHRYHEKDKTKIREKEMTDQGKEPTTCQKIVGYDANALYLWAIMQNMPTGSFTRRREDTGFKRESTSKMATEWLEWKAHEGGIHIRHQTNNTEKRIGERRIPVDGFHSPSQTVFQFHGCWWHGHNCHLTQGKEMNEKRKKPMVELLKETKDISKYIKDQGYKLIEMWECQWRRLKRTPAVQQFLNTKFRRPLDHHKNLSEDQILTAIRNESLFSVVECDIRVPDHLRPKFSEMCPIFKNLDISREDIGPYMQAFAEEQKIMSRPRRSLIGSYFGEKILLATPLIKWYLDHGLEVTHIYQVVEYTPEPCFKPFGEAVSDARRAGDVDPNKAIIADTMKLVSCYFIKENWSGNMF